MAEQHQQPLFSTDDGKPVPRFLDGEDLEALASLAWPMDDPETYQIIVSGELSKHPGRLYIRKGYLFCFWLDAPIIFNALDWANQEKKRFMEQQRFAQKQILHQDPANLERLRQISQNAQVKK